MSEKGGGRVPAAPMCVKRSRPAGYRCRVKLSLPGRRRLSSATESRGGFRDGRTMVPATGKGRRLNGHLNVVNGQAGSPAGRHAVIGASPQHTYPDTRLQACTQHASGQWCDVVMKIGTGLTTIIWAAGSLPDQLRCGGYGTSATFGAAEGRRPEPKMPGDRHRSQSTIARLSGSRAGPGSAGVNAPRAMPSRRAAPPASA